MTDHLTVLVVGATGSIGRHVLATSVAAGHTTRALARNASRARGLDPAAEVVIGDFTDASTLTAAVDGIDAAVFTHGDNSNGEAVNYGAVRNVLQALNGRPVRIALMTTVGATVRHPSSEWKRRGERLVRASGNRYTIVRPGWFDYNDADQLQITMRQGDTHQAGNPADGVIARHQIARVLIDSLTNDRADHRTLELVAERGPEQDAPSSQRSTPTLRAHWMVSTTKRTYRSTRNRNEYEMTSTASEHVPRSHHAELPQHGRGAVAASSRCYSEGASQ